MHKMKAYEVLEQNDWCQNVWARNANGEVVEAKSDDACRFCAGGAIVRAYLYDEAKYLESFRKVFQHTLDNFGIDIFAWNDSPERAKEEVVSLLKELDI